VRAGSAGHRLAGGHGAGAYPLPMTLPRTTNPDALLVISIGYISQRDDKNSPPAAEAAMTAKAKLGVRPPDIPARPDRRAGTHLSRTKTPGRAWAIVIAYLFPSCRVYVAAIYPPYHGPPATRAAPDWRMNTRASPHLTTWSRNLAHRPRAPAAGNGRLQRAVMRALIVGNGQTTTASAATWAYVRRMLTRPRLQPQHYRHIRRALRQMGAVPIGRSTGGRGRSLIWRAW
jgi:hypothetical protein